MASLLSEDRAASSTGQDDDAVLQEMGYVPSFQREFTSLSTVCNFLKPPVYLLFMCALDQLCFQHHGSVLQHRDYFQHASVVRGPCLGNMVLAAWLVHVFDAWYNIPGHTNAHQLSNVLGASVAEVVSAFPTCGGVCVFHFYICDVISEFFL